MLNIDNTSAAYRRNVDYCDQHFFISDVFRVSLRRL